MNRQIEDMHLQQKKLCAGLEVFLLQPRLNRIKYFGLFLFWITIIMSGAVVMHALSYFLLPGFLRTLVVLFILFGLVFSLINIIFLKIRRLHDFNYSGWWILVGIIPVIGALWFVAIFLIPGTTGTNRFGVQPKAASRSYSLMAIFLSIVLIFIMFIPSFMSARLG